MRLLATLLFASLSTTLLGQGVVPPFQVGQVNPLPGLNPGSVPSGAVHQVHMVHLPGDPANVFYCAASVTGLSATYGGSGGGPYLDLVCGSYDVLTDTFTPNSEAAALNTNGSDGFMTLHHTGLFAVFDRGFAASNLAQAWLASRPATGQPWQIVGRIVPLPPNGPYLPALADYQGQTYLLYSDVTAIVMAPIDLVNAVVTGSPTVIVNAPVNSFVAWSPIPVTDPNGELIGVSHSVFDLQISNCDHYMSLDLDPSTPPVLMNDVTTWTMAGGFIGGRFFDGEAPPLPPHIFAIDTCWFTGGRAPVGGTMYVRMFSPPTSGPEVYLSLFAASMTFTGVGQPIAPVQGLLGINAAGAWASPLVLHNNANGEAQVSFVIPNVPGLSGARLSAQSATWETVSGAVRLGNTAQLVVD